MAKQTETPDDAQNNAFLGQFPYRRKWTKNQTDDIFHRYRLIAEAMTDAVGPMGQQFYVPPELLEMLALHMSLAGCTVRDELAYIVSRPAQAAKGSAIFDGAREWVLKSAYEPSKADERKFAERAKRFSEDFDRLDPEHRKALMAVMAERLGEYTPQPTQPQEIVDAHAVEADLPKMRKDGQ